MTMNTEKEVEKDNLELLQSAILEQSAKTAGKSMSHVNQAQILYEIKNNLDNYSSSFYNIDYKTDLASGIITTIAAWTVVIAGSWILNKKFDYGESLYLIDMVLIFFSMVISMMTFIDGESESYGWIKKIFYSTRKAKRLKKGYADYLHKIEQVLQQEKFQHGYVAHLQLKLGSYEKVLQDLQKENNPHDYNVINYLNADLIEFKTTQANAIRNLLSGANTAAIHEMCNIETLISKMDSYLSHNQNFNLKQEKFIKAHQQFMNDQGINTILNEINQPELKEVRVNEEQLKTLL
jgi:hypothetical protein